MVHPCFPKSNQGTRHSSCISFRWLTWNCSHCLSVHIRLQCPTLSPILLVPQNFFQILQ